MFITLAGCGKKAKDSVSSEYIGYEEGMLRIEMTNRTKEDVIYGYPYALYKKLRMVDSFDLEEDKI